MSSKWKTVSLGDCVNLTTGYPFKSSGYTDSVNAVRLLRGDNIGQGILRWNGAKKWPNNDSIHNLKDYELSDGDVVLAMDRPWIPAGLKFGRVRKIDLPALLVQRVARLRPSNGITADYLFSILSSREFSEYIQNVSTGTAVPHISAAQIRSYAFELPDVETQLQIGSFHSVLDDRISLLRETNKTLESIAQAIFKSWFVDFDPVRAKMEGRQPEGMDEETAALFPDSFEESELGLVPKGWIPMKVSDVADVVKGKSYSSKDLAITHNTALVTLKSFQRGGGFRMDGFKPYTGTFKPSQVVSAGDLIVAYTDVTQAAELIGKPAIVVGIDSYTTLVASLDVGIVRPNESKCGRQFLYGLFKTESFQAHTLAHTSGTTVLHLAKNGIGSYLFAYPGSELTRQFEQIASSLAERRQTNNDKMHTISDLRDALLPRLISGQLRLPEAQEQVEDALS